MQIINFSTFLGINLKQHCTYHPQSGGAVERENGTIKNKLVKCCDDTGLSWIKALPVVLMAMRGRARTGLSPFEILPGRPMNTRMEKTKENQVLNSELLEDVMLSYCVHLTKMLSLIHTGKSSTPATSRGPVA